MSVSQEPTQRKRKTIKLRRIEVLELRAKLPKLTKAQIRRYRLPYDEAVIIELDEEGFPSSAIFLDQLFKYQDNYRNEHSYDVIILARPVLREQVVEIDTLYNAFKLAEGAHYRGDFAGEIDELTKVTYHYAFGPVDWWWLAEQLFNQCLNISENYIDDDRYRQTRTYYIYGKYLVEQAKVLPLGMQYLNVAREFSLDKDWTASTVTGRVEKYIFVEVCTVLYQTLMRQSRLTLKYDPILALELCLEARQRGIDACLPRADVFFLQGQCEMEIQQAEKAVGSFMKAFLLYRTNKQMEKCCDAMICLAQAFQEMGKLSQTKEQLENLLAFAQREELENYVGLANLYIGQYFLNAGTPEFASPYLTKAFDIFHKINDVPHREFVKNLGAVSKGQEVFAKYAKLILRCEDPYNENQRHRNLDRLLKWKDSRTPFWDDMSESLISAEVEEEMSTETTSHYQISNASEEVEEESNQMQSTYESIGSK